MSIEGQILDLDKTYLAHPEIQPYFFSGQDISPPDKEYPLVFAQAEYLADFIDSTITIGDRADQQAFNPAAWDVWYRQQFRGSPILCRLVLHERDEYGPKIVSVARANCGRPQPYNPIFPARRAP